MIHRRRLYVYSRKNGTIFGKSEYELRLKKSFFPFYPFLKGHWIISFFPSGAEATLTQVRVKYFTSNQQPTKPHNLVAQMTDVYFEQEQKSLGGKLWCFCKNSRGVPPHRRKKTIAYFGVQCTLGWGGSLNYYTTQARSSPTSQKWKKWEIIFLPSLVEGKLKWGRYWRASHRPNIYIAGSKVARCCCPHKSAQKRSF